MARTKFELKTLHKISGLPEDFNRLMKAATEDCLSRPGVTQKRQVTIVVDVLPNPQDPEQVVVKSQCKSKTPCREASAYVMNSTVHNELSFQPHSPMEPDQGDLFEGDD